MLSLPANTNVYLCAQPVDLRRSFDGLSALVESVFQHHVLDGHLFLFVNKRRDRIKALWWDRDGLVIWYKKLETVERADTLTKRAARGFLPAAPARPLIHRPPVTATTGPLWLARIPVR